MGIEEKLLDKINNEKHLYTIYHGVNAIWIDMEDVVAKAVYHTASFEDSNDIIEYVTEGYSIEESMYEVLGAEWFQDHCSGSEYLDNDICDQLIEAS